MRQRPQAAGSPHSLLTLAAPTLFGEHPGLMLRRPARLHSRCGLDGETVVQDLTTLKGRPLPYLSMIIIKKQGKSR